ncbi:DUF2267 domain-containing protein [Geomonas sp. RF6]|uniref:DUF2267 domain-containing protein n=1 Tax=Geomonas sp. RF6 TaxID=2897342 RepID=UPI001E5824B4|nr:DUF2267 domain-containing protein [Geomonas sp. RF6]UFS70365.1 DUF2267 domain-containing protein [Geomonas sp. RF6]
MKYEDFLEQARRVEFFQDEKTIESAVRMVLGILVSRLDEDNARLLTSTLPQPLTYEALRRPQARYRDISADDYIETIAEQFHLRKEHALRVVTSILWIVKNELPREIYMTVSNTLPADWKELLETGHYNRAEEELG